MSDAATTPDAASASKADPAELTLRGQPRAVTRLNRRVLIVLAGALILFVFGAALLALDPPTFRGDQDRQELYNTRNKPTAEGLAGLPSNYAEVAPKLGPPLPGDLGGAVLQAEQDLGLSPPMQASMTPDLPFRPSPEDDAARAERIRQARQDQEARESSVFFKVSARPQLGTAQQPPASDPSPFAPEASSAIGGDGATASLDLDRQNDQNLQGRKLAFLNQEIDRDIYNPHALQDPASPYQVMAGTIIPASLITGINSDLPGDIIAQVTEHVYDTVTGRFLLIPQGSRLIGAYDSVIAFGQDRALVIWNRIILPDGSSIVIENLPATDTQGYAGLEDKVDFHTWRLLKGIVLSTLLGVGTELTFGGEEGDLVRSLRESSQDSANQVGQRITERNLNIQPTIDIRFGWPLRVIVNKDLILRPYRG
ncbi:MAG: TrbI/VirB10 family protein [Kiloniellales bacterium]|nr:TrbI/VirB10 family protein [Kiloniellales bacterium]